MEIRVIVGDEKPPSPYKYKVEGFEATNGIEFGRVGRKIGREEWRHGRKRDTVCEKDEAGCKQLLGNYIEIGFFIRFPYVHYSIMFTLEDNYYLIQIWFAFEDDEDWFIPISQAVQSKWFGVGHLL